MSLMTTRASDLARLRMDVRYHRERRDLYRAKVGEPHAVSPTRLRDLERMYDEAVDALEVAESRPEEPGAPYRVDRAGARRPDDSDDATTACATRSRARATRRRPSATAWPRSAIGWPRLTRSRPMTPTTARRCNVLQRHSTASMRCAIEDSPPPIANTPRASSPPRVPTT